MPTYRPKLMFILTSALMLGHQSVSWACNQRAPTRAYILGPHDYEIASSDTKLWREGDAGERLFLNLRVLDTCGEVVPGARVRLLHANHEGNHAPDRWRADVTVADDGQLQVSTVLPGYAGDIPRHIHFIISHPNHHELITRLYFKDDPLLEGEDDLSLLLEAIQRDDRKGWVSGYEFVLSPQ